ncbi:MAG TPA: toxin-antitoxin system protein, partial [Sulfuricurvum kujiense]
MKKFDEWNEVKKDTDYNTRIIGIKPREIFWAKIGENVGYEQNGKGDNFARPVLIIKKLTKEL